MAGVGGEGDNGGTGGDVPMRCVGDAAPCEERDGIPTGAGGAGGSGYACTGGCFPVPQCAGNTALGNVYVFNCATVSEQADCEFFDGCMWDGSSCSGVPRACSLYRLGPPNNEEDACNAQPGCSVVPCRGQPISCDGLPNSQCEDSPGCELVPM